MIYIYCGEDSISARFAYVKAIEKYKSTLAEIVSIAPSSIVEVKKGIADNMGLFSTQTIFCVENLEKSGFRKSTKAKADVVYEAIVSIAQNKSVILLDFEEGKQGRQLKLKDLATIHESKPSTTIFKLLDECIPGDKNSFIQSLRLVCSTQEEQFVFIMLYRHIRLLVLLLTDGLSDKLPPWQKYKVLGQAKKWEKQSLIDFYSGLIRIEIGSKTSSNPYGIRKSIEILACHYL